MLRIFTSFDYDNDDDLRILLVGQARNPNTPFELADWSVKDALSGDWQAKVRERLRRTDRMIVLCGECTHTASGVSSEIEIARSEGKPYYLLKGRASRVCTKPKAAANDPMYEWTHPNLKWMTS